MVRKLKIYLLFLLIFICLSACGTAQDDSKSTDVVNEEESAEKKQDEDINEDDEKEQNDEEESEEGLKELEEKEPDETDIDETGDQSVEINVYYGNDDATAFETEKMQIVSLNSEAVLDALVEKGVVVADIDILSLETTIVEGVDTVEIDFNDAFSSYISSMGSTGEYYIMGSICNTFLDAYNCEQIKITIEGNTLETGHAEYPGYMSKFS